MKDLMKTLAIVFGVLFLLYGIFGIAWAIKGVFTLNALCVIAVFAVLACKFTVIYLLMPKSKKPQIVIDEEFYAQRD